jgi:hypothetical protein
MEEAKEIKSQLDKYDGIKIREEWEEGIKELVPGSLNHPDNFLIPSSPIEPKAYSVPCLPDFN